MLSHTFEGTVAVLQTRMLQTGQRSWYSLSRPCAVSPYNTHAALKTVIITKSIWKLITDSLPVAKMQKAISAMGPVHNKPSPDVSVVVSRMLYSYLQLYKKVQTFCPPAEHWQ